MLYLLTVSPRSRVIVHRHWGEQVAMDTHSLRLGGPVSHKYFIVDVRESPHLACGTELYTIDDYELIHGTLNKLNHRVA